MIPTLKTKKDHNKHIGTFKGYDIYVSDKYPKKYYAMVGNRKVYFGDINYQHYKDKMGYYSSLDHLDKVRREHYKMRHEKDRHMEGTAGWFADQVLW